MIETINVWFNNLWLWCVENKDAISTFFMSGQFITLVSALVMLIKNIKQVKSNTDSTKALDATLINTNTMSGQINQLSEDVTHLTNENESLREDLAHTQECILESNQIITDKLNAIIEVQSIVYSTIRDDSVRQTVNTILNNARYSEKNFKEQLENEIVSIKQEFDAKMNEMNAHMNVVVQKVVDSVNASETAKNRMKNKNSDESTRY